MARPDAAKYDPAMAFFILVTEFHSRIYGLLAFKVASEKQIETIGKMRWFNEALERGENKDRMKQLGGFLSFSRTLLREFSILGMAKAFENVIVTSKELGLPEFKIWSGDKLGLPYHHEMRCVRNFANVVKHNDSRIVDDGNRACRFLIDEADFKPGTTIAHMEFDIEKSLFQTWAFLGALSSHLTGVPFKLPQEDEAKGLARFKRTAPWFIDQQRHPE